ncbi:hypothetical protein [uncultured Microbacterium sp.]|nr:hypothetical protein [uncultured Microbacterium sp.]
MSSPVPPIQASAEIDTVARIAEQAPPLTDATRARLALLLKPSAVGQ